MAIQTWKHFSLSNGSLCGHTWTETHRRSLYEKREQILCEGLVLASHQVTWTGTCVQAALRLPVAGRRPRENSCLEERMPCADIKVLLLRGGDFYVVLAEMATHSDRPKAHKRLGMFWTWRELLGAVAFIPFQPFTLTWRLPVSSLRLTAWGSHFLATGTGAGSRGSVFWGDRTTIWSWNTPRGPRQKAASNWEVPRRFLKWGACTPGVKMTHYGTGWNY